MMWFFLVFDYKFFNQFVDNNLEVDRRFIQFIQKAVSRSGFYIQDKKSRDSTSYYHFLLSPLSSQDDDLNNDLEIFQRVCFFYHFPHEDVQLSGQNINAARIIFISR